MRNPLRRVITLFVVGALAVSLAACSSGSASGGDGKTVRIGVLAREEPDLNFVAEHLAQQGYTMKVQVFDDNIAMNRATEDGSIDANFFQNANYLKSYKDSNGSSLVTYGPWLQTTAVQFVSSKYDSADALPNGARIGIANDSANRARELQLLAANGLIELAKGVEAPTILDVTSNPKNLRWVEVNPRSKAAAFPDLDAMTAPSITVYLMKDPSIKALYEETPEVYRTYGGTLWVVKEGYKNTAWLDAATSFMQSADYKTWIANTYKGLKKTP
ncbi:MetQ/NlpA family ABC transporter substrate-binding protein [Micromonospora olivasterospora]|uniref:D-methionine transport system substrate-binding protein n=1 Tax=Micromonospora olivasterospora TaxID=1880 RepID=A0A562I2Z2_MICOL|nr:MetQ/NlpA family ABC transporter substrate-binding protein [Micromonospora olivasterospora]TWH65370.1 D-methionine transport system substrate-binding protein [Micromonospora olivasterospora]